MLQKDQGQEVRLETAEPPPGLSPTLPGPEAHLAFGEAEKWMLACRVGREGRTEPDGAGGPGPEF